MRRALLTALFVALAAILLVIALNPEPPPAPRLIQNRAGFPVGGEAPGSSLEGLRRPLEAVRAVAVHQVVAAQVARDAAQRRSDAAERSSGVSARSVGSGGSGGVCGMNLNLPAYIVQRESRGQCDAVNSSSGTFGPAQLDPRHFERGGWGTGSPGICVGLSYESCVNKLVAEQGLDPWKL